MGEGGWQRVASLADLDGTGLHDVAVGRELVLLIRQGDGVLAVQGLCPHQFARLAGGRMTEDGLLQCPHHMARFRLTDGACAGGWSLPPLRRYAVRLDGGNIALPDPLIPLPPDSPQDRPEG
ncbi:MAG: Rieske (2Fe-2S) protein [Pseudomonadota bacterium]